MDLYHVLTGALVALVAGLLASVLLLAKHVRTLREWMDGLAQAVGDVLGDMDATLSAMREDASALDDAIAELVADIEAIKRNPLGPPVDDEEDADAGLSD